MTGLFLVAMAVRKYSEEKAAEKKEQVYSAAEANKFSKLAFGGWDMKMFDASSVEDAKIQASENMHMALKEQDILDKIANRSKKEKQILLSKQISGIFINAILIGLSWFVIGYLTYLSGQTTSFFSDPDSFVRPQAVRKSTVALSFLRLIACDYSLGRCTRRYQ